MEYAEADWADAHGHYWRWNGEAGHWDHDRTRCDLLADKLCEAKR